MFCPRVSESSFSHPLFAFSNATSATQKLPSRLIFKYLAWAITRSRLRCSASRIEENSCSAALRSFSSKTSLLHIICEKSISGYFSGSSNNGRLFSSQYSVNLSEICPSLIPSAAIPCSYICPIIAISFSLSSVTLLFVSITNSPP